MPDIPGTCIGEYCCSDGQTWDASLNQCIGSSNVVDGFATQRLLDNILTKKQPGKYKDDINMGIIQDNNSKSFINNSKFK